MSSSTANLTLEQAIRDAGEGWLIDWFSPRENAIEHIRRMLDQVNREAHERLRGNSSDISERALLDEYRRNPQRIRAFFQALGGTRTPEMLLMVWRILQGMKVKDVSINYHQQESFEARVVLESPYGVEDPPYQSTNIHDFALFRHLGIMEIGQRPVLQGFYPLKVREG